MGLYQAVRELYKNPKRNLKDLLRERLIKWRRENSIVKIEKPTRIDRARSLGYKAKQGYIVVRVRVKRGGRKKKRIGKGRRSKRMGRKKIVGKSYQWVAEERANKKYKNCEVLNSYQIAKDGNYYWFEIILVDRMQVSKYRGMEWLLSSRGRVYRGLTSAGKKSRGLSHKGKGVEKIRPSLRSYGRIGK